MTQPTRRLRVEVRWGEHRLEVRDVALGEALVVGPSPRADVHAPTPDGSDWELARVDRHGTLLLLPPGAEVRSADATLTSDDLLTARRAERVHGGATYRLGDDESATIRFGTISLHFGEVAPEPAPLRPMLARLDLRFATAMTILLMSGVTAERMFAITFSERMPWEDAPPTPPYARAGTMVTTAAPKPPVVLPKPTVIPSATGATTHAKKPSPVGGPGGPKRDVNELGILAALAKSDALGKLSESNGQMAVALAKIGNGPAQLAGAGTEGIASRGGGAGGNGPGGPLGIGKLGGGDPHGRGIGPGGDLTVGLGPKKQTVVIEHRPGEEDGLSAEVVGRVIRKHFNEVKACYEAGLQADASLAGKFAVAFEIVPNGLVGAVSAKEDDLGSASVRECILRRVQTWAFPAPKGGGSVSVTYPFVFTSSN